jgi:prolipoprotein diacylglyceryltransferase
MGVYEETYGLPTTLPWGVNLGDNIPRHPVCLYEILFLILLWIMLVQTEKRCTLQNGARFKMLMIAVLFLSFHA